MKPVLIDWTLVARIAGPVLGAVVGALLVRFSERRSKLITYLGHTSAFDVRGNNGEPGIRIHTHAIVVRNSGKKPATNVRVTHYFLPQFQLTPPLSHTVEPLPAGGAEIVFPTLVPGEQVAISYLYFPPLVWNQVHINTKSDEGFARVIQVLPTPQLPLWQRRILHALLLVGCMSVLYVVAETIVRLLR